MWARNDTDPNEMIAGQQATYGYVLWGDYYAHFKQETLTYKGYNIKTGAKIWESEPLVSPWDMYHTTIGDGPSYVVDGKIYHAGYGGILYCIDITNGETLWSTKTGSSGTETPYGVYPFFGSFAFADGKIYAGNGEHSPNTPLYRGERLWCFDADNGDILWKIEGWWQNPIISDGYLVTNNGYDMQWYTFGKGPSVVTVSASPKVSIQGSNVVIEGMVTDESPGAKQYAQTVRFPHGVPVIADDSMGPWMEYLYMQQPLPTDATGVEVLIDVVDSNGNYRNIGKTTSDCYGFYSFEWQPDIPGKYTVVATFAGSESYYASYSETAFTVAEAPLPPVEEPVQTTVSETYFVPAVAGIIVVLIVGFALVAMLLLRKRP
jgi:hypothetical protein